MSRVGVGAGEVQRIEGLESIVQLIIELQRAVNGVEFGDPNDPEDPDNTDLAGAAASASDQPHQGNIQNVQGSWVEVNVTSLTNNAEDITCTHNLYLDEPDYTLASGTTNVRWLVFGVEHTGSGITTPIQVTALWNSSNTITANSIELTFNVSGTITVNSGNPVKITLFFVKASK